MATDELTELRQMNAVLKYDWLALCGLRESYLIARGILEQIAKNDYDAATSRGTAREALRSMIEPPPENVRYQGSCVQR